MDKFRPLIYLLLLVMTLVPRSSNSVLSKNSPREFRRISVLNFIINGFDSPAPRPFFAKLLIDDYFCGATIIDKNFAVTAAHCIFLRSRKFTNF